MSSEVCPFCGKSFKRLKSHLPHCKSAPRREDAKITSENPTKSNAKPENSSQKSPLEKQDVTFSVAPKTNKKTKLKVSEKIKIAAEISSPVSVESSQPSSTSKSKTKINLQTQNDQESVRNNPKKLNLRPNAEILPEYFEKQESKSSIAPKSSKKTKPKLTEKLKLSPKTTKSFENSQTATKETKTEDVKDVLTNKTFSNNSKITPNNAEMNLKDNFWPEDQNGVKILPEIDPWNKRETKITLEDVRSALRRAKQNGGSKKIHLTDESGSDEMKCETLNQNKTEKSLVKVEQGIPSQLMTLKMSKNEITASESEDFLSKVLKTENRACSFSGGFVISSDALRMDRHSLGFAAESRPLTTILQAEVSTEAFRKDLTSTLNQTVNKTVNDAETTTTTTRDAQRRDEGRTTRDVLKQQRLAHVTLRELPDWLVVKAPRRPADVMDAAQRGWRWYYRRYIDVKRGGVGGVAMLLAGYCVLSYVWNFPRLKRERWRKFH